MRPEVFRSVTILDFVLDNDEFFSSWPQDPTLNDEILSKCGLEKNGMVGDGMGAAW